MKGGIKRAGVLAAAVCCALAVSPVDGSTGQSGRPDSITGVPPEPSAERAARRPNIVLITVDDMMASDLAFMPRTRKLLARRGTVFTQGLASTSICVPARASQLTGQYAHNHGAVTVAGTGGGFKAFRDTNTLPVWLRRAGYDTLFVGKYLNGYGDSRRTARYVPPGWSGWRATLGDSTYHFRRTRFSLNGRVATVSGYSTDVLARFTTEMLDHQHDVAPRKPFFLAANYVAPHHGGGREPDDPRVRWGRLAVHTTSPAARHRNRFRGVDVPRVPEMWKRTSSSYSGPTTAARLPGSGPRDVSAAPRVLARRGPSR